MAKKASQEEILGAPDKMASHTYGVNGILASLFRHILAEYKVGHVKWGQSMHRYLNDPRNRIPRTGKDHSSIRSNIAKELFNEQMTWKVFCKGLTFLQFFRVRFFVEIENTRTGEIKVVGVPVNFNEGEEGRSFEDPPHEHDKPEAQTLPTDRNPSE